MNKIYNVGIIGCGLIGNKRAFSLGKKGRVFACADIDIDKANTLASKTGALPFQDWKEVVQIKEIDIIIISTLHDTLAEISLACIKLGKHVLVEKPAARSYVELDQVIRAKKEHKSVKIRVGFNHRFHPALLKAKEIINKNLIGELMFIRGRYGHGRY